DEGVGDAGVILDEAAVESCEAQECTDVGDGGRNGEVVEGGEFVGVGGDAVPGDNEAAEFGGWLRKGAFGKSDMEVLLLEGVEDGVDLSTMVFKGTRVDEDVVKVNHSALVAEGAQDVVHEEHEGSRSRCEAEGEDEPFIETILAAEGGLMDVRVMDANLVAAGPKVKLGEVGGSM
ncbi:hypothetical protein Vafri_9264, partial [Volvox africanus]